MRIRPASAGDAPAVAALWTQGYSGRGEGEGRRTRYDEADYTDSARAGRVFVAEREGEVIGVVVFFAPGAATWKVGPGEAGLSRLVVGESAQGRGGGRALVEHCTALARKAGAEVIVLWSRRYQRGAHRLYESQGYRRAPQRDSRDADGERWVFTLGIGGGPRAIASAEPKSGFAVLLHSRHGSRARIRTDLHFVPARDRAARRR